MADFINTNIEIETLNRIRKSANDYALSVQNQIDNYITQSAKKNSLWTGVKTAGTSFLRGFAMLIPNIVTGFAQIANEAVFNVKYIADKTNDFGSFMNSVGNILFDSIGNIVEQVGNKAVALGYNFSKLFSNEVNDDDFKSAFNDLHDFSENIRHLKGSWFNNNWSGDAYGMAGTKDQNNTLEQFRQENVDYQDYAKQLSEVNQRAYNSIRDNLNLIMSEQDYRNINDSRILQALDGVAESMGQVIGTAVIASVAKNIPDVSLEAVSTVQNVAFFSSIYGRTFAEDVSNGIDVELAHQHALAIAITEHLTEQIGGIKIGNASLEGIGDKIVEEIAKKTGETSFRTMLAQIGKTFVEEGFEEVIADFVEGGSNLLIGDKSIFETSRQQFASNLMMDFLAGGISGGVLGTIGGLKNYALVQGTINQKTDRIVLDIEKHKSSPVESVDALINNSKEMINYLNQDKTYIMEDGKRKEMSLEMKKNYIEKSNFDNMIKYNEEAGKFELKSADILETMKQSKDRNIIKKDGKYVSADGLAYQNVYGSDISLAGRVNVVSEKEVVDNKVYKELKDTNIGVVYYESESLEGTFYNANNDAIYINVKEIKTEADVNRILSEVLAHELVHNIKADSSNDYDNMNKIVEELLKDNDVQRILDMYYADRGGFEKAIKASVEKETKATDKEKVKLANTQEEKVAYFIQAFNGSNRVSELINNKNTDFVSVLKDGLLKRKRRDVRRLGKMVQKLQQKYQKGIEVINTKQAKIDSLQRGITSVTLINDKENTKGFYFGVGSMLKEFTEKYGNSKETIEVKGTKEKISIETLIKELGEGKTKITTLSGDKIDVSNIFPQFDATSFLAFNVYQTMFSETKKERAEREENAKLKQDIYRYVLYDRQRAKELIVKYINKFSVREGQKLLLEEIQKVGDEKNATKKAFYSICFGLLKNTPEERAEIIANSISAWNLPESWGFKVLDLDKKTIKKISSMDEAEVVNSFFEYALRNDNKDQNLLSIKSIKDKNSFESLTAEETDAIYNIIPKLKSKNWISEQKGSDIYNEACDKIGSILSSVDVKIAIKESFKFKNPEDVKVYRYNLSKDGAGVVIETNTQELNKGNLNELKDRLVTLLSINGWARGVNYKIGSQYQGNTQHLFIVFNPVLSESSLKEMVFVNSVLSDKLLSKSSTNNRYNLLGIDVDAKDESEIRDKFNAMFKTVKKGDVFVFYVKDADVLGKYFLTKDLGLNPILVKESMSGILFARIGGVLDNSYGVETIETNVAEMTTNETETENVITKETEDGNVVSVEVKDNGLKPMVEEALEDAKVNNIQEVAQVVENACDITNRTNQNLSTEEKVDIVVQELDTTSERARKKINKGKKTNSDIVVNGQQINSQDYTFNSQTAEINTDGKPVKTSELTEQQANSINARINDGEQVIAVEDKKKNKVKAERIVNNEENAFRQLSSEDTNIMIDFAEALVKMVVQDRSSGTMTKMYGLLSYYFKKFPTFDSTMTHHKLNLNKIRTKIIPELVEFVSEFNKKTLEKMDFNSKLKLLEFLKSIRKLLNFKEVADLYNDTIVKIGDAIKTLSTDILDDYIERFDAQEKLMADAIKKLKIKKSNAEADKVNTLLDALETVYEENRKLKSFENNQEAYEKKMDKLRSRIMAFKLMLSNCQWYSKNRNNLEIAERLYALLIDTTNYSRKFSDNRVSLINDFRNIGDDYIQNTLVKFLKNIQGQIEKTTDANTLKTLYAEIYKRINDVLSEIDDLVKTLREVVKHDETMAELENTCEADFEASTKYKIKDYLEEVIERLVDIRKDLTAIRRNTNTVKENLTVQKAQITKSINIFYQDEQNTQQDDFAYIDELKKVIRNKYFFGTEMQEIYALKEDIEDLVKDSAKEFCKLEKDRLAEELENKSEGNNDGKKKFLNDFLVKLFEAIKTDTVESLITDEKNNFIKELKKFVSEFFNPNTEADYAKNFVEIVSNNIPLLTEAKKKIKKGYNQLLGALGKMIYGDVYYFADAEKGGMLMFDLSVDFNDKQLQELANKTEAQVKQKRFGVSEFRFSQSAVVLKRGISNIANGLSVKTNNSLSGEKKMNSRDYAQDVYKQITDIDKKLKEKGKKIPNLKLVEDIAIPVQQLMGIYEFIKKNTGEELDFISNFCDEFDRCVERKYDMLYVYSEYMDSYKDKAVVNEDVRNVMIEVPSSLLVQVNGDGIGDEAYNNLIKEIKEMEDRVTDDYDKEFKEKDDALKKKIEELTSLFKQEKDSKNKTAIKKQLDETKAERKALKEEKDNTREAFIEETIDVEKKKISKRITEQSKNKTVKMRASELMTILLSVMRENYLNSVTYNGNNAPTNHFGYFKTIAVTDYKLKFAGKHSEAKDNAVRYMFLTDRNGIKKGIDALFGIDSETNAKYADFLDGGENYVNESDARMLSKGKFNNYTFKEFYYDSIKFSQNFLTEIFPLIDKEYYNIYGSHLNKDEDRFGTNYYFPFRAFGRSQSANFELDVKERHNLGVDEGFFMETSESAVAELEIEDLVYKFQDFTSAASNLAFDKLIYDYQALKTSSLNTGEGNLNQLQNKLQGKNVLAGNNILTLMEKSLKNALGYNFADLSFWEKFAIQFARAKVSFQMAFSISVWAKQFASVATICVNRGLNFLKVFGYAQKNFWVLGKGDYKKSETYQWLVKHNSIFAMRNYYGSPVELSQYYALNNTTSRIPLNYVARADDVVLYSAFELLVEQEYDNLKNSNLTEEERLEKARENANAQFKVILKEDVASESGAYRSTMANTKGFLSVILSVFQGENTMQFSKLVRGAIGDKDKMVKAILGLLFSALMASIVDGVRKLVRGSFDDDRNALQNAGEVLIDDFFWSNLVGCIPVLNHFTNIFDVSTIVEGKLPTVSYEPKESPIQPVYDLFKATESLIKNPAKNTTVKIKRLVNVGGQLIGFPTGQIFNLVQTITRLISLTGDGTATAIYTALSGKDYNSSVKRAINSGNTQLVKYYMNKNTANVNTSTEIVRVMVATNTKINTYFDNTSFSYEGKSYKIPEKTKKIYRNKLSNTLSALISNSGYSVLKDEKKAKAIQRVFNYYYNCLKFKVVGKEFTELDYKEVIEKALKGLDK